MWVETHAFQIAFTLMMTNVVLSALHAGLSYIKDKTKNQWDDRAFLVVSYLLDMLNWLMANRRNPPPP